MGNCVSSSGRLQYAVGGISDPVTQGANEAVDYFLRAHGYRGPIDLTLSASNLRDRNMLSKNDPLAVVYAKGKGGSLQELGRTEVVLNSLNPEWITKIRVIYYFEMVQTLLFRVYDVDTQLHSSITKDLKLDDQHYVGEATCALSEIVSCPTRACTLPLVGIADSAESSSKILGRLTVHAEEVVSKTTSVLILRCKDLEYKSFFSQCDPFLVISKDTERGTTVPICRTEVLKKDLRPVWKPILLNLSQADSKELSLLIECFNFNSSGRHHSLGRVQTSLAQLEKSSYSGQGLEMCLPIYFGQNRESKLVKTRLFVDKFFESVQYSFLDYLSSGCELNFMVAIDFTSSNGNPRLPDSLHHIDHSGRPNAYQKVIQEVGDVLQFYDNDRLFPSWGFGARLNDGPANHCFNLNGSTANPEVEGIQGIMAAYEGALHNVTLGGPTQFGPDGVVTDLQETIDAIVEASHMPLSILIVGVGGADFNQMEILDADNGNKLRSSTGRVAFRDKVQFVPLRDVQGGNMSFVESLLAELPSQYLTYMRDSGIEPIKL